MNDLQAEEVSFAGASPIAPPAAPAPLPPRQIDDRALIRGLERSVEYLLRGEACRAEQAFWSAIDANKPLIMELPC